MPEADMKLNLPQSLNSLVSNKFTQALQSQSLIFSATELAILHNKANIPFQLRFCPALSQKPVDNKEATLNQQPSTTPKKKFDPFENPSPDLLIAEAPDVVRYTHNLVLNKYPVIPNHFILSTRDYKLQTNPLEENDIALTYACLQVWHNDQSKSSLFAFFNSGEHSGASQPHRHLQFLPVEDMRGSNPLSQWDLLCNRMTIPLHAELGLFHDPSLPILHLATPLSPSMPPSQLHEKYTLLLRASALLLDFHGRSSAPLAEEIHSTALGQTPITTENGQTNISYNLAMTPGLMAILPRRAEDAMINGMSGNAGDIGSVSINGTILAGTLMVKNENEWEVLKARPELLDSLLKQIGFSTSGSSHI